MMRKRLLMALLAGVVMPGLLAGTVGAAPNPPGNNGTVKIDGLEFDNPDHPDNEPHVGCWFQVDFYGYDEGDKMATATLDLHPPTVGADVPLTKSIVLEDDAAGGGTDLDGSILFTTADIRPWIVNQNGLTLADMHPIQGFHVKLTVHAEGSRGADTKHKVFWIRCHDGVFPDGEVDGEVQD